MTYCDSQTANSLKTFRKLTRSEAGGVTQAYAHQAAALEHLMRPWLTVVALFIWTAAADYIELEECHGLKFHCLDISTLARYGEFEECDLDKVRVLALPSPERCFTIS